jgi:hypothetical protein
MTSRPTWALGVLTVLLPSTLLAEERLTIVCKFESTYNFDDGTIEATAGSASFTIIDESIVIGDRRLMSGSISDRAIDVTATQDLGKIGGERAQLLYRLMVDRYSGHFELLVMLDGEQGGLLHQGVCRPAERLF